tara:strand:- start:166 stop:702 length:537 start_codon:yes stop_codon:yes gene_type:complete
MSFPNTSVSERWATPQWLFDRLDAEFHFDLDAAADSTNHKCKRWIGQDEDALALVSPWYGPIGQRYAVWCNPPYRKSGGGIYPWLEKGLETARNGTTCVMLIYARTDTRAWTEIVHPYADEVRLIAGRLKFDPPPDYTGTATTAGAPSAVIIFRPETAWMGRPGGAQYRVMEQVEVTS